MRKYNMIGICPVVIDTITGETMDLCWFYYPELRPLLSTRKIADNQFLEYIKSWDDYFFFHGHVAPIYAMDSKMLVANSESSVTLDKAKLEAELELIEFEHRLWLRMYGQRLD
jgi:hypothetical protein